MMFEDAFMVVCLSKLIKVPLAEMQVSKLIVKVKLLFSLVRYKYLVRNWVISITKYFGRIIHVEQTCDGV